MYKRWLMGRVCGSAAEHLHCMHMLLVQSMTWPLERGSGGCSFPKKLKSHCQPWQTSLTLTHPVECSFMWLFVSENTSNHQGVADGFWYIRVVTLEHMWPVHYNGCLQDLADLGKGLGLGLRITATSTPPSTTPARTKQGTPGCRGLAFLLSHLL